jgi:hypothetical protein
MEETKLIKVLYFTMVNLDRPNNGGVLVCRNHVRRLAQDPRLSVTLCNTGSVRQLEETQAFAASIGVPLHFIPFQKNPPQPQPRWPFFLELYALAQAHVDKAVLEVFHKVAPDIIVIDYLFSALFVRSLFATPIRKVMITLNRELEFYREQKRIKRQPPDPSEERLAEFERAIYRACNVVVALTAGDIPPIAAAGARAVPPLFDPAPQQWSYRGGGSVVFVGNVNHYPNLQAVEWIATRLAPALEALQGDARLQIVGAAAEGVPAAWRRPNITYLGVGDAALVTTKLLQSDLFIAPIANNFGSKIKLLDCLSHATPFMATEEALSGVTFLDGVPRMRLDQPHEAAASIAALLQDGTALTALSRRLAEQLSGALKAQEGIWSSLFQEVLNSGLPPMENPPAPQPDQIAFSGVRRNEPCPCGSGKRFKHCHGQLV